MSAVVTDKFRFRNAEQFKADALTSSYYLAIGRSEAWPDDNNAPLPSTNTYEQREFWQNLQAMKLVTDLDMRHCVPRYDWVTSTHSYDEFNDRDPDLYIKRFYAMNEDFNLYLCIKAGAGLSTVKPTGQSITEFGTADGYIWKYLLTVTAIDSTRWLTSSFIPIRRFTQDELDNGLPVGSTYEPQRQVALNAIDGAIHHSIITNGGSGYTTATITIEGDGTGATADAVIVGGVITDITSTAVGSGYKFARIVITGDGTNGTAFPVIAPAGGHGFDAAKELGGYLITANIQLVQDEGQGDFTIGNDYRQLGIVRDPFDFGTTNVATDLTLNGLKELTLTSDSGFLHDEVIVGTTSGATAVIDYYISSTANDPDDGEIRYHQNDTTGYIDFQVAENITGQTSSSTALIQTLVDPEVEAVSGEIIFIENRSPINRASDQTESIKLVIEF